MTPSGREYPNTISESLSDPFDLPPSYEEVIQSDPNRYSFYSDYNV